MNRSKIYPVKSNAARSAAQYGLNRGHLFEVYLAETGEKGWAFSIPANVTPIPQKKAARKAKAAAEPETSGQADKPASEPEKPKAERKTKPAKPAKVAKAKPAKAAKAKPAKAAKPAKSSARNGKTAEFIAEARHWVEAEAMMKKYGWNSNTFRGVLGNYKLKTAKTDAPMDFIRKREDGKTFYRIVSLKEAERLRAA